MVVLNLSAHVKYLTISAEDSEGLDVCIDHVISLVH